MLKPTAVSDKIKVWFDKNLNISKHSFQNKLRKNIQACKISRFVYMKNENHLLVTKLL